MHPNDGCAVARGPSLAAGPWIRTLTLQPAGTAAGSVVSVKEKTKRFALVASIVFEC